MVHREFGERYRVNTPPSIKVLERHPEKRVFPNLKSSERGCGAKVSTALTQRTSQMMPGHLSGNGGVHERKYLKSQHDPYSIKGAGGFSSLQGYPFLSALVHPTICGHD